MKTVLRAFVVSTSLILSGCGTKTPDIVLGDAGGIETAKFARTVVGYVRCELSDAVLYNYERNHVLWLDNWSSEITLTLSVDEKSTVAPNLSISDYLAPQTQIFRNSTTRTVARGKTLGLSGSVVIDAQRHLKLVWFEDFRELMAERRIALKSPNHDCSQLGSYPINGDIKIADALAAGTFADGPGLMSRADRAVGPLKVIEHRIAFQADVSGSVTPSITLFDVAANSGSSPFFTSYRMKKHELLISMGPVSATEIVEYDVSQAGSTARLRRVVGPRRPSDAVLNSSLASQIGQAVSNAISNR